MMQDKYRSLIGIGIALLIVSFTLSPQFRSVYALPMHIRVSEGETALLNVHFPLTVTVAREWQKTAPVFSGPFNVGKALMEYKLLGVIPLRTVEVDVMSPIRLIPGGHSIGVILHSHGVIVVGNSPVQTEQGEIVSPAKSAGIHTGDVILSVNGTQVESDAQLAEIIDKCGRIHDKVTIVVKRGEGQEDFKILPLLCSETHRYRIGLYVRDSAAGVGTLTFYDPNSHMYGALGHTITDSDTNQPIDCEQGKIVMATVSGIQEGKRGKPGEKIGVFMDDDKMMGTIIKNTKFGIYGHLNTALVNELYPNALPVASMNQVQPGPAEMLTVIEGQKIESFDIQIQKVNLQDYPEGKGLVVQVTDPKLLEKTGGIVQGMSGSPIIQNGKIVGAITHVFVHDPTRGYGCFIDWMLMEMGITPQREERTGRGLFSKHSKQDGLERAVA
jgi:stage IV sporulation protein B